MSEKSKTKPEIKSNSPLIKPRITEKAVVGADKSGVYVFDVRKDANKITIGAAVKETYKVTPVKVRIAKTPDKEVLVRGRSAQAGKRGVKRGGKKAYVYLKKGDKIEIL